MWGELAKPCCHGDQGTSLGLGYGQCPFTPLYRDLTAGVICLGNSFFSRSLEKRWVKEPALSREGDTDSGQFVSIQMKTLVFWFTIQIWQPREAEGRVNEAKCKTNKESGGKGILLKTYAQGLVQWKFLPHTLNIEKIWEKHLWHKN